MLPMPLEFPSDSNVRYLPLAYLLPEDMIAKCPTLRALPRKVREVVYNESMMALVDSDPFLKEIMDAISALAFPHFGFGGWKEHYTGYCPVWQLSYALPVWARVLEAETGWGLQSLFLIPSDEYIPFFNHDYIKNLMGRVVKRAIKEEGWQPTLDIVRKMPCDEDFERWATNARRDFLRKWYHTRSKRVQTVSLEACIEDGEHGVFDVEDVSSRFEDRVVANNFYQWFKARLSEKDMTILELRVAGFTYEEIADKLGYKNHSGVIKRIQSIAKAFVKYEERH
jgi:hypothetical protein